jgi:hypothetical protein
VELSARELNGQAGWLWMVAPHFSSIGLPSSFFLLQYQKEVKAKANKMVVITRASLKT